jgi:drug/metabolite transporter (DMT)-like permease
VEHRLRAPLALAYTAICVIWGSTYLAIKVGLESFDPFFYAGVRYTIATGLLYLIARAAGAQFGGPLRRWLPAAGIGILFIAVSNGLVFWSETRLDSGFTALLISASPVWTAVLTPLLPGERRLRALGWVGIVLGMAGTAILLQPWKASRVELVASLAVEVSVVAWVVGALWIRHIRHDFHPLALTVAHMAGGAPFLLLIAALRGRAVVGPVTATSLLALAYLIVFGSCVAFTAYFFLLRHWEASRVATSTYVNPVIAVILGAIFLSEPVTGPMVVGAAIVLAGVALVLHEQRTAPQT